MDSELARHVVRVAYRVSAEFDDLREFLDVQGGGQTAQFREALQALGQAVDRELLTPVFASFPELKREAEAKAATFGQWIG